MGCGWFEIFLMGALGESEVSAFDGMADEGIEDRYLWGVGTVWM
jgi:hypothetical protein